uniref:Uncharacterized protein n=1 Tax=Anguilla anguilla TaxID=7936 RepID=A0A0E9WJ03_ANGAN
MCLVTYHHCAKITKQAFWHKQCMALILLVTINFLLTFPFAINIISAHYVC